MAEKMTDEQINKIAQALAAKLAEPGGNKLLGCGSASSSQHYDCRADYRCSSYYECGGAEWFSCDFFTCNDDFKCTRNQHTCYGTFRCSRTYSW